MQLSAAHVQLKGVSEFIRVEERDAGYCSFSLSTFFPLRDMLNNCSYSVDFIASI